MASCRCHLITGLAATAVLTGLVNVAPAVADSSPPGLEPSPKRSASPSSEPPTRVPDPAHRLGKSWKTSADRAVTTAADSAGLKVLAADSKDAYQWRTVATLAEPGMPADSWIGNFCVMDRDHAAVVYAPRTFTNKPDLMQGGAFTAVVDLKSGQVTKLPFTGSLAYFDPSCNPETRTAAFTAFRDSKTRLITVDTSGKTTTDTAVTGQITSAVPTKDGLVAAHGRHLVHVDPKNRNVRRLAAAKGVPFDIRPTRTGIAFLDRSGNNTARAKLWKGRGTPSTLASGKLGDLALDRAVEAGRSSPGARRTRSSRAPRWRAWTFRRIRMCPATAGWPSTPCSCPACVRTWTGSGTRARVSPGPNPRPGRARLRTPRTGIPRRRPSPVSRRQPVRRSPRR